MKKFGFKYKIDKTNELINRKTFEDIETATEYFAKIKKLTITNFLKIYKVIEIQ